MFQSLSTFVLLALLASSASAENSRKNVKKTFKCVFSYLKDENLLESVKFLSYEPVVDDSDNCESRVNSLREEFLTQVELDIKEDADFGNYSDCIIEKLRSFNSGDAYLEKFVYLTDKSMSTLKRNLALNGVFGKIEQKMIHAQEFCAPDKIFGEWFDNTYGEDPAPDAAEESADDVIEDLQEDYCQRKHLVDIKFIDTNVYNVTINPKHIDTTNVDCKSVYLESIFNFNNGLENQFGAGLKTESKKISRCFKNKIKAGNYAESMLKNWIFSEIRLTAEQKKVERAGFITLLKNLYQELYKCQWKLLQKNFFQFEKLKNVKILWIK